MYLILPASPQEVWGLGNEVLIQPSACHSKETPEGEGDGVLFLLLYSKGSLSPRGGACISQTLEKNKKLGVQWMERLIHFNETHRYGNVCDHGWSW